MVLNVVVGPNLVRSCDPFLKMLSCSPDPAYQVVSRVIKISSAHDTQDERSLLVNDEWHGHWPLDLRFPAPEPRVLNRTSSPQDQPELLGLLQSCNAAPTANFSEKPSEMVQQRKLRFRHL